MTVALDASAEAARPWIEAASARHPSLIDSRHVVADRYGFVNVPTAVWIDEAGTIVRPPAIQYGTDTFRQLTRIASEPFLDAIRRWVRTGEGALGESEVRKHRRVPTGAHQLARAEFALAVALHERGDAPAAERHFVRAGELAPIDWTIRRGALPMRGIDSMGEAFVDLWRDWKERGEAFYPMSSRFPSPSE